MNTFQKSLTILSPIISVLLSLYATKYQIQKEKKEFAVKFAPKLLENLRNSYTTVNQKRRLLCENEEDIVKNEIWQEKDIIKRTNQVKSLLNKRFWIY